MQHPVACGVPADGKFTLHREVCVPRSSISLSGVFHYVSTLWTLARLAAERQAHPKSRVVKSVRIAEWFLQLGISGAV